MKKSDQENVQRDSDVVCAEGRVVAIIAGAGIGRQYVSNQDRRLRHVNTGWNRKADLRNIALEGFSLVDDGLVLTAAHGHHTVAGRGILLLFTAFSVSKKRHALDFASTEVYAHHEIGAGEQHQEHESYRRYFA